jgi:hypothetical protein
MIRNIYLQFEVNTLRNKEVINKKKHFNAYENTMFKHKELLFVYAYHMRDINCNNQQDSGGVVIVTLCIDLQETHFCTNVKDKSDPIDCKCIYFYHKFGSFAILVCNLLGHNTLYFIIKTFFSDC